MNLVANPILFTEIPCLYIIPKVFFSQKKQWNNILLFIINLGHEDLKRKHTPGYLVPTNYKGLHLFDENANTKDILHNISISSSEKGVEMLATMLHLCRS